MAKRLEGFMLASAVGLLAGSAHSADPISVGTLEVDRPTLHALGVRLLISGDDDRDAVVSVRYRKLGDSTWRDGLPLLRVWPETVSVSVPQQFAGSVFDLTPDTDYEIELSATDPDGGNATKTATAKTRPVPRTQPAAPNAVNVTNVAELTAALAAAKAGDVITLADGSYAGSFFSLSASGTADNPIVLRGASQAGTVLDGQACTGCNIVEVYGSHVHIEQMTIKNGERAIRFQGADTTANVVRRLTIENVVHGIGSKTGQTDFYVCDNTIEGKLKWPWTFASDATSHWDDRGVDMTGDGHVICHNLLRGFGDPVVNKKAQVRSWDVYGNDVYDSYDGTELDESEGNARLFGNRFTNVMDPVSIQPVHGGPAYVLRNVVMNAPEEVIKLKSLGGTILPSGALIFHNTFVSAKLALNLQTPITQHNFRIENNLFVGPETLVGNRTVEWTAAINGGTFDHNGYYPDGGFWFGVVGGKNRVYTSWADVQAKAEVEKNGVLLGKPIFEAGFVGPADEHTQQTPPDFTLATGSNAIDKGGMLPGINAGALGAGPDLGALESGCPKPAYGPRPAGQEALTNPIDCSATSQPPGDGGVGGSGGTGTGGSGASSGSGTGASSGSGTGASSSGGKAGSGNDGDDGGCGCALPGRGRTPILAGALMLLGLLLSRPIRRPGRPSGSA